LHNQKKNPGNATLQEGLPSAIFLFAASAIATFVVLVLYLILK
jgi:hypothetical protein